MGKLAENSPLLISYKCAIFLQQLYYDPKKRLIIELSMKERDHGIDAKGFRHA